MESKNRERGALRRLARLYGIETSYVDDRAKVVAAGDDVLLAVLQRLGAPIERMGQAPRCLRERRKQLQERVLEPVLVVWEDAAPEIALRLPGERGEARIECTLSVDPESEEAGGAQRGFAVESASLPGLGRDRRRRVLSLEPLGPLPRGVHRLELRIGGRVYDAHLIAAPAHTWRPEGAHAFGWGVFTPLWALRSQRSPEIGDFRDLERLADLLAPLGADTIATLPLLPLFLDRPFEPSPYAPVSRLFWNELYAVIDRAPESKQEGQALCARWVDYRAVAKTKREAFLRRLRALLATPGTQREAFLRACEQSAELRRYARFRAALDRFGPDPSGWPQAVARACERGLSLEDESAWVHAYAQWVSAWQLEALAERLRARGQRLYLDVPLGVHPRGFDAWRYEARFCRGVSLGAPPDALGPEGQCWGFWPLHPERTRADAHAYFRASLSHPMRVAGVVRIDHVMALWRGFWIPDGFSSREGVYVRYPHEELLALVCLLSHRHRVLVVGENLGTVPARVVRDMRRRRLAGMHVLEFDAGGGRVEPGDVASLDTHDTPLFCAWLERRREEVAALVSRLVREGWIASPERASCGALAAAALASLGVQPASLVVPALEDLWGETEPVNVPGTTSEQRPNWRRRHRLALEEAFGEAGAVERLFALALARRSLQPLERAPFEPPERSPEEPRLGALDRHLFHEGTHRRLWACLGAHLERRGGQVGVSVAVWAPNARAVSVIADTNGWDPDACPLVRSVDPSVWEGFLPGARPGERYKFHVVGAEGGRFDKADPFAFASERPPGTASRFWAPRYRWRDRSWLEDGRKRANAAHAPISIYELHLGSWRRVPEEGDRWLGYRELAPRLVSYVRDMGFSHVEFLPLTEHPFYGSWGYQSTAYFAPTARYGEPEELMFLVDALHEAGIGVILDWVPSHVPGDAHGLVHFDGTPLFEDADPLRGRHPEWNSFVFDYGKPEVRSFLISSALFWLERYHMDGLRVDAVASMLYLDYARGPGQWRPNRFGGRENLEAVEFLRRLNLAIEQSVPGAATWAEESSAWPLVTAHPEAGGLGFHYKWDMGWMHDTLGYFSRPPGERRHHHEALTFRMLYAQHERFCLPLSHDEVVHEKGSLWERMPGDRCEKAAHLRLLFAYQWTSPGKKLLFMGGEWGQEREWNHDQSLDWSLLDDPLHAGLQRWVRALNHCYRHLAALHELDHDEKGFCWIDCHDAEHEMVSYLRFGRASGECVAVVLNLSARARLNWRFGVPFGGGWRCLLDSSERRFGGIGAEETALVQAQPQGWHGQPHSIVLDLPPLSARLLRPVAAPLPARLEALLGEG